MARGKWYPFGKRDAEFYDDKIECEAAEGQICYFVGRDIDLRVAKLVKDEVVEDPDARLRYAKADAILEKDQAKILSNLNLMKSIAELEDRIHDLFLLRTRNMIVSCGNFTTVAGGALQTINVTKAGPDKVAIVVVEEEGATPVTIKTVKCDYGKIEVTMSADPGSDHKLNYILVTK